MTDSEGDISNLNVFTFQNENTTMSARGPNINLSFRSQVAPTKYMPRNFERQCYAESVPDQRMRSQRSVFNGRSGSPMSMRSIDSSASVSAADIAFAFKNNKYNKYDMKVIKEAYHKLMKQRIRKRREKRRKIKLFLRDNKTRSTDDSGEQGSDSSISSDDCRSVKTSYKEYVSSSRLARIDLTDFRKTVQESNVVRDCTDSFRQNTFKNMFSLGPSNYNRSLNLNCSTASKQSNYIPTQRDRFQNGFLLPSQRFNQSIASTVIPENLERCQRNKENDHAQNVRYLENKNCENGSEEEIFSNDTVREKSMDIVVRHKRSFDSDDDTQSNKKVPKTKNNPINNNDDNSNNFEFAKPTLPVRKPRSKVQEKVIAKSKQPLTRFEETIPKVINTNIEPVLSISSPDIPNINKTQDDPLNNVSMRPSFIKRKLFTQKLDVAEKANLSSDVANSPQNVYSALQKEKNKARKLVTTQSCMNREVQDDNNILYLIHQIVPADSMNITNQTSINQTKTGVNSNNKQDDEDKWDVTSVVSMCNEDDVSDTFTDEEIFESDVKRKDAKKNQTKNNTNRKSNQKTDNNTNTSPKPRKNTEKVNLPQVCNVVVAKIPNNQAVQKLLNHQSTDLKQKSNVNNSIVKSSAETFWHTDYESEAECPIVQKNYGKENQPKAKDVVGVSKPEMKYPVASSRSAISKNHVPENSGRLNNAKNTTTTNKTKNNTVMNNTLDYTPKLNFSTLSLRSHRASKKNNHINFPETSKWLNNTKNTTLDSTRKLKSMENTVIKHKRRFDSDDDTSLPNKKKSKISSTTKKTQSNKKVPKAKNNPVNNNDENSNNFEFAKPTLPVRKPRSKVQEKVIAKSKQPLTGFVEVIPKMIINTNIEPALSISSPDISNINKTQDNPSELSQNNVSMHPSFIKRKLFTQKLDMAEKANLSSDVANSPQNVYSTLQEVKNKARKLVTTQSCMNREVQDDNNILDWIHQIVPADRINITNRTSINQTKTGVNSSNKQDDDDKWDVTSVVSMCNEDDVSDTFTDEEMVESDVKWKDAKKNQTKNNTNRKSNQKPEKNTNTNPKPIKNTEKVNLPQVCNVVVAKIPNQAVQKLLNNQSTNLKQKSKVHKSLVKSSAKAFWQTDYESEAECPIVQKNYGKENKPKAKNVGVSKPEMKYPVASSRRAISKNHVPESSRWLNNAKNTATTNKTKNNDVMNSTLDYTPKFNISPLSLRSHCASKKNNHINVPETSKWLNNTKNVTLDSTRKFNISSISLRSHRTSRKKICC